jgi:hypothetical protein
VALPKAVEFLPLLTPPARPVRVVGDVLGPPAVTTDNYLGGSASGLRFRYNDRREFVWWTSDERANASFSSAFSNAFEGGFDAA